MSKYDFIKVSDGITSIKRIKEQFDTIEEAKFDELIKLDPTYNNGANNAGKYAEWILRLYKNNKLKVEDFYKLEECLKSLKNNQQRLKSLGVSTDINIYENLPQLSETLDKLNEKTESRKNKEVRAAARNTNLDKDAKLFMSTENFDIYSVNI